MNPSIRSDFPSGERGHVAAPLAEGELEDVDRRAEDLVETVHALLLDQRVGVLLPLQVERRDLEARGEEDRRGPERGVAARFVAVVGDDDAARVPAEERGLSGCQRGPHGGDHARDAGMIDGDGVEVAFHEDGPIDLPHGVLGAMQVVEQPRLVEDL